MPSFEHFLQQLISGPVGPKGLAIVAAVLLMGWGSSIYRMLVLAPGVFAGLVLAVAVGDALKLQAMVIMGMVAVLGVIGALFCHFLESWAVRTLGAVLFGGLAWWLWPLIPQGAAYLWLAPLVGALLGALIFPAIHALGVRAFTALGGAACIAWAIGRPGDPIVLSVGTVVGFGFQTWLSGRSSGGGSGAKKK